MPIKSPPAVPFGGKEVGITPAASFALVTDASTILIVVTLLSASLAVVITPLLIVGLGYVPVKSPPAVPFGGKEVGITPAASFALVTEASTIFAVVTELFASFILVTEASASFAVVTAAMLIVGLG